MPNLAAHSLQAFSSRIAHTYMNIFTHIYALYAINLGYIDMAVDQAPFKDKKSR